MTDDKLKSSDTRVDIGGVMRCCTGSLGDFCADDPDVTIGQYVPCKYHDDGGMVLRTDKRWVAKWVADRDGIEVK
jgi:hypothetical protein